MKKIIEVTPIAMLGIVPNPGFYENCGMLYMANGSGVMPTFCGSLLGITQDPPKMIEGSVGGVSESTLLKAIAIAMRPDNAKSLIG